MTHNEIVIRYRTVITTTLLLRRPRLLGTDDQTKCPWFCEVSGTARLC